MRKGFDHRAGADRRCTRRGEVPATPARLPWPIEIPGRHAQRRERVLPAAPGALVLRPKSRTDRLGGRGPRWNELIRLFNDSCGAVEEETEPTGPIVAISISCRINCTSKEVRPGCAAVRLVEPRPVNGPGQRADPFDKITKPVRILVQAPAVMFGLLVVVRCGSTSASRLIVCRSRFRSASSTAPKPAATMASTAYTSSAHRGWE